MIPPMLIIDGHLDLAWNALQWNRNLNLSVATLRTLESGTSGKARAQNTVCFPEMREAPIFIAFATLLARSTAQNVAHIDYPDPAQAFGIARGQMAYYQALEKQGKICILKDKLGLERHLSNWQSYEQQPQGICPPLGFFIMMESADAIMDPEELEDWWQLGLRSIGPAHYGLGRYAGGTSTDDGLTDLGFSLLKQMEALGIILDLTHLSDKAFWQSLDSFAGTVIASHNNCRALVPHQRQFSDEQIREIIERQGVIGVAFDTWMLEPAWIKGVSTNSSVGIETVLDHIDHICQLAGNPNHVAIGSDLDGGFGREQSPYDLNTICDLARIPERLKKRGYSETSCKKIMHGNWLGILQRVLA